MFAIRRQRRSTEWPKLQQGLLPGSGTGRTHPLHRRGSQASDADRGDKVRESAATRRPDGQTERESAVRHQSNQRGQPEEASRQNQVDLVDL